MKLFISYSRDDSSWTYEFWHRLREDTNHYVWIDQRLVPATDWWRSILEQIEVCDCFLMVMSPKAVESIYCLSELGYAVALNKPVLPLMLRPCELPDILRNNRVQYQDITSNPSMERVLIKVLQGLNYIELALERGEYPAGYAARPPEPKPRVDAMETLLIAEDAAAQKNYSLAENLLRTVIKHDKGILKEMAKARLDDLRREQECHNEYLKVKALAENPLTVKLARKAWQRFVDRYGTAYDPHYFAAQFQTIDEDDPETEIGVPSAMTPLYPRKPPPEQSGIWLVVRQGPNEGISFRLEKRVITVGRHIDNDIVINAPQVSRYHLRLTQNGDGYILEDLDSRNGTLVDGQPMSGVVRLESGQNLMLGSKVVLSYEAV